MIRDKFELFASQVSYVFPVLLCIPPHRKKRQLAVAQRQALPGQRLRPPALEYDQGQISAAGAEAEAAYRRHGAVAGLERLILLGDRRHRSEYSAILPCEIAPSQHTSFPR